MSTTRSTFTESHDPPPRNELLRRRIADLNLQLKGTRLERLVQRLYAELQAAGLAFHPPVYLSDDWGCPDRVPIIGVPFYLADAKLTELHDELMEGVEAETDDEIMRYLRHEAGHAFNYAYTLFDTSDWTALFGPFTRPYPDHYTPNPFSRSYVRHLPAWYAQKHPDEDFAETFAVWLDPASKWREVYAGWACLAKLEYAARIAREIGAAPPGVTADTYDTREEFLGSTIEEHYGRNNNDPIPVPRMFDVALRDIFDSPAGSGPELAADFLSTRRRMVIWSAFYWTGLDDTIVRALIDHLQERCRELGLVVGPAPEERLIEFMAFVTTLCMNHLRTGEFVQK